MAKEDRTALIMGSGRNMGRARAKGLAGMGCNIVVNGSSKRDDCDRVADEARAIGTDAIVVMADIGDKTAATEMARTALSTFGRVPAPPPSPTTSPETPMARSCAARSGTG